MQDSLTHILLVVTLVFDIAVFLVVLLRKPNVDTTKIETEFGKIDNLVRSEFSRNREEFQKSAKEAREELTNSFKILGETLSRTIGDLSTQQKNQLETFSIQLQTLTKSNEDKIEKLIASTEQKQTELKEHLITTLKQVKDDLNTSAKDSRNELTTSLKSFEEKFAANVKEFNDLQRQKFGDLITAQEQIKSETEKKLEGLREAVDKKLQTLQEGNEKKLEEMRATVDEKLQATVEQRFDQSFKIISERLEQVHKGLGEMQTLATGVGDLKKVLSNVKTRGNLGEIQLGAILEEMFSPDQYEKNISVKDGSAERVEFAIKLPGRNDDNQSLLLPIDSKFPNEDYQRLLEVFENIQNVEPKDVENAIKLFENAVKKCAKDIRDKYINPPKTTDFAIMFVPTEGLYAEILRRTALFETLRKDFKITVVGPTNLVAFLNCLQMGFRTLAIEKRSSEVWEILGAVKTEFGNFGKVLDKTKKKLQEATNTIDAAGVRTRAIERQLRKVQELPQEQATALIGQALELESEDVKNEELAQEVKED